MSSELAIEVQGVWKIFGEFGSDTFDEIRANDISKEEALESYNCVIGVADVSFDVNRGEIFCVMGLSGSGKSTLVRHINRLLEPTAGSIRVGGEDIMSLSEDELRRYRNEHIAMVFQNFALLPHLSVLENIAIPLEIRGVPKNRRRQTAEEILSIVELTGWGNKFAHELSGGMQQRVGLARALAANSEVLLMDEPFSALDPLIRRQLQTEFLKLSSLMKKTTVFITHDLEEAVRIGHRIAIMRAGRIVQIGTPEEIVMHPADAYVAEFVAGISRLKIASARTVMQPLEAYEQLCGPLAADAPEFGEDVSLNELIHAAIESDSAFGVTSPAGERIGAITRADLFKGVVETSDHGK